MRSSQAERVATVIGHDIADIRASEYQPGMTAVKLYTPSHDYYCSPNRGQCPPKSRSWEQIGEAHGLPVYRSSGSES